MNKIVTSLAICMFISGCGPYYKNVNPERNNQQSFNIDSTKCEAIAQQARSSIHVSSPTPVGYKTVGYMNSSGKYKSVTQYQYDPADQIAALGQMLQAQALYSQTKEACLSELGWVRISKEEFDRMRNQSNSVKDLNSIENTLDVSNVNGPYGPSFHHFRLIDPEYFIKKKINGGVAFGNKSDTGAFAFQILKIANNISPSSVASVYKKSFNVQNFEYTEQEDGLICVGNTTSGANIKFVIKFIGNNEILVCILQGNVEEIFKQTAATITY